MLAKHRRALAILVPSFLSSPPALARGAEFRLHPEYRQRMAAVRTIAVVAPSVIAYEVSANNTPVVRPDWTEAARANVASGLEAALRGRRLNVKRFDPARPAAKEELRDVSLLYEAVASAILQATYANQFPAKRQRFEYALGDLGALLAPEGVDALVFAEGAATISSGGRVLMQLLGGAGPGIDRLFVAVVDRSGTVLWFGVAASTTSDLRYAGSAESFVRLATDVLPAVQP